MRNSLSFFSIFSTALITLTTSLPIEPPTTLPGTFSLQLTRKATYADLTSSTKDRNYLLQGRVTKAQGKFNLPTAADDSLSKRTALPQGFVQLGDTPDDTSYYATILLGTPPVAFEVALDTGSSDLIIVTDPCYTGCYSDTQLYRPQDSSTSSVSDSSFYIGYVSGSASGLVESDVMSFAGYTIPNQVFGAVNRSDSVVSMGGVSGLLGLAFQPLAATGSMPFVEALWKKNLLADPVFSFGFARWGKTTEGVVPGGICTVGGTNSSLYSGSINYVTSTSDYWAIPLGDIISGGQALGISYPSVFIDTGTSEVYFPPATAAAFYANIPGARDFGGGLYAYHCAATGLGIQFQFGGVNYPMNDLDFNIGYATEDGVYCYGAVGYIATPPGGAQQYIFGDAFLKNVYSVFRFSPPSVGFATLANPNNVLQSGFVPIGNGTTIAQGGNSTTGIVTVKQQQAEPTTTLRATTSSSSVTPVPTPTPTSSYYVAPPVVKSVASTTAVSVASVQIVAIAPSPVAPKAAVQAIPTPVLATSKSGISSLAGLLQDALVSTIASNSVNAVLIITCQPPKVIDKSTEFWTCSS